MLIAGIDVETSGLDFRADKTIEVAAVLWDTEKQAPAHVFNSLVRHDGLEIPGKITELTGIDTPMAERWGIQPGQAAAHVNWVLSQADCAMAFEAEFDKKFIYRLLWENGFELPGIVWSDARYDPPFKGDMGRGKLTLVLARHEIINYLPHRALGDIMCTLKMASRYPWSEIVRRANTPTVEIQAHVSYKEKDLARDAGFIWIGEDRLWCMKLKEEDYDPGRFCFPTSPIERSPVNYTGDHDG